MVLPLGPAVNMFAVQPTAVLLLNSSEGPMSARTVVAVAEHAGAVERIRAYQELAVQRMLNHARLARMIEHEAFHGDSTYTPSQMLGYTRAAVWRDARAGRAIDTYRRNLQRRERPQ